jgi:hypothetical protein
MKVGIKMNEVREKLETDLLAIIKEGQNLTEGFVEVKPGVKIRAGREREFERLCDNYYELEFNQVIENDTDTITPVYESLTKLVEIENEEFYISKASEFVLETKDEIERFKNLVRSYNSVDNAYKLTVRNLNDLYLNRENNKEWQDKVDELNAEVKRLSENSSIITEQINASRKKVNEALIKHAEEQMEAIRQSFLRTSKETDKTPALDHNYVLANDVLEYNSLYRLVLILKHANNVEDFSKLVVLDNMMMVTEEQKDILTSTILPNIKLYGYIKAPEKKETDIARETNNEFIAKIQESMKILEGRGKARGGAKKTQNGIQLLSEYRIEYDKLLDILKVLNKANASDLSLLNVWDSVYVLSEDKDKIIDLLSNSKILKNLNPDNDKIKENEKLIEELYAYLDEMANKVSSYTGVANLPIKSTNAVGDKAWAVIESDFEEANRIVEIIKLLQNQNINLIPVWGIANVSSNDISKFKRLANATKRFGDKAPNISENLSEMDKVRNQLRDLIIKAKGADKSILATNGLVLAADYELYKLLEEKFKYLDAAKASDNLVNIDGVLVDGKYVSKYHEANEKIDNLLKVVETTKVTPTVVPVEPSAETVNNPAIPEPSISEGNNLALDSSDKIDFSLNDKKIAELKGKLNALSAKSSHNELERKMFDLLSEQIEILENAKKSQSIIDVNGFKFATEAEKEKYLDLVLDLDEIEKGLNQTQKIASPGKSLVPHDFYEKYFGINDMKIAELKKEMASLESRIEADELAKKIYEYLAKQVEILEKAKTSESVIEMLGLRFANEEDKLEYLRAQANLDEILKDLKKTDPKEENKKKGKLRKKVTAIRDFLGEKFKHKSDKKFKLGDFFVKHKDIIRILIGIGLGITAVTLFLPQLVPTIIFSNSCLATAAPWSSGILNGVSSLIAPLAGISFVPGVGAINLGVSANLAGPALVNALAKVGIVGIGIPMTYKSLENYLNKDLSELEKKTIIQRLMNLVEDFKKQWLNAMIGLNFKIENIYEKAAEKKNELLDRIHSGKNVKDNEVQKQIADNVSQMLDEQQVAPTVDAESSKKEMTTEEKIALGEKIKQASKAYREKSRLDQAKKLADEEGISLEDALKQVEQRNEDLIRFSSSSQAPVVSNGSPFEASNDLTDPDLPSLEEVEEARKLQAAEEEAERLEKLNAPDGDKPVVTIPSDEEIINQLGSQTASDGKILTSDEIQTMLNGSPVVQKDADPELLDNQPSEAPTVRTPRVENLLNSTDAPDTSKTAQVIDKIINPDKVDQESGLSFVEQRELETLEVEIKRLQSILDATKEERFIKPYQDSINQMNARRDELLEKKNKGRG